LLRQLNAAPGDSAEHRAIRAELRRREVEKPPSRVSTVRRFYLLTANETPGVVAILYWYWQQNFLRPRRRYEFRRSRIKTGRVFGSGAMEIQIRN
jgi:hypothetical protein